MIRYAVQHNRPRPKPREDFLAHLQANPPTKHHRWLAYVIACSRPGIGSSVSHFGEWLKRKSPVEFEDLYRAWLRKHSP